MEELVWHPDTALGLHINELGKTITEFVKKDPFQYGIDKQTTSVLNGIASILCSIVNNRLTALGDYLKTKVLGWAII